MGQINTNNYPTVNSLADADLLIVENAANGTGTTTPKQLRENAIGTGTLHTSAQTVIGAVNELKREIDLGAGVVCYDVNTITSGYLGGQFSGSANLLLLHLTTDGTADATNGYMMMLSYSRPVARFAIGRLVDADGVAYKQDVYADNTIICKISNSGEGTESDPVQVVILGIINAGFMLTPTAVVSDRDIIDGQGNTLSVLAEALTKTASGNPVVISDCAGGKARSLITEINAIQDLHGLPFPYVGGAGKNKLPTVLSAIKANNTHGIWDGNSFTYEGITATVKTDSVGNITGFSCNGTSSNVFYLNIGTYDFVSGTDVCMSGGKSANKYLVIQGLSFLKDTGSGIVINTVNETKWIQLVILSGQTCSNEVFYPQIEIGNSKTSFAPYSNICPISGRDSVVVDDVGANLASKSAVSTNASGAIVTSAGTIFSAVEANKSYVLSFNLKEKMSASSLQNRRLSLYLNDSVSLYQWTDTDTSGRQRITITPTASGYLNFWAGADVFSVNTEVIDDIYLTDITTSATIQLGTTVYGADINWDTGVMTVKTTAVDGGSLNWSYWDSGIFIATIADKTALNVTDIKCSCYKRGREDGGIFCLVDNENQKKIVYIWDSSYSPDATGAAALKTALTGQQIEYRLAAPTTIQLTPKQLEMLKGYNRVSIDNGSIEVGYIAKLT